MCDSRIFKFYNMKLKPIPKNTVVHTPTQEEAKELLAILHENGYTWQTENKLIDYSNFHFCKDRTCYVLHKDNSTVTFSSSFWFESFGEITLTLAEFKERYVLNEDNFAKSEEEKPQPRFKVGDKVRITTNEYNLKAVAGEICEITKVLPYGYHMKSPTGNWFATDDELEPYTEPETKPTEDMETKELNLVELLKGHEGEEFFVPICGTELELKLVERIYLIFYLDEEMGYTLECNARGNQNIGTLDEYGKFSVVTYPNSACMVFPSRALYEKYPLDAPTAWRVWQEGQKKYELTMNLWHEGKSWTGMKMFFSTTSDRDKCISEIKQILNKYSK